MNPKIGWVKWKNPYTFDNQEDNFEKRQNDTEEKCICDDEPHHMKYIMTPMGPIPLPEHSAPHKIFNFWVAHTNFYITQNIAKIVETTPGVEVMDIFTPYRMRVGIGKMFSTKDTIEKINNRLYKAINNTK